MVGPGTTFKTSRKKLLFWLSNSYKKQYDHENYEFLRSDILSEANRPNLFAMYVVAPNSIEKLFGINAPEVAQVITFEDNEIRATVDALKQTGIYDQTDIVITADHGNTAVNKAIPDSGPGSIEQFLENHGMFVLQATADQIY